MANISTLTKPIHRKTLNKDQLNVLHALYKFRFGTTDLLKTTQSKQITRQYMNKRLQILSEQEYIGRRYNKSYKLQAKFAQYYLLPKGIEVLKKHPEHFKSQILRNIKKDIDASERFARHSINVFTVYTQLKELYGDISGDGFHFYTKNYMVGERAEGFPKPLPDGFISFRPSEDKPVCHYLVECFDDTMPQSAMRKRIEQLVDHADSEEWTLTNEYPGILLVCETERLQKNVERWAKQEVERSWQNSLTIEIVTIGRFNRLAVELSDRYL
jgi:hypothetical protein